MHYEPSKDIFTLRRLLNLQSYKSFRDFVLALTHTHTRTHTYTHAYIQTNISMHANTHRYIDTYHMHMHTYKHTHTAFTHMCTNNFYIHTQAYVQKCIHICAYAHIQTRT